MTGSLVFQRQHSSTSPHSNKNKTVGTKPRRCSSADSQISSDKVTGNIKHRMKALSKSEHLSSDSDSGIEDSDRRNSNGCKQENPDINANIDNATFEQTQHLMSYLPFDINDLYRASKVPDSEKKEFCLNTSVVFHGEFARCISCLLALNFHDFNYCLIPESESSIDPYYWPGFAFIKTDNAKAQFKCQNMHCGRSWTSMRARVSFKVSFPQPNGFVTLKLYGQMCQQCETLASPSWYPEEVCRVMKNLANAIFTEFCPQLVDYDYLQDTSTLVDFFRKRRRIHHDPNQRSGTMKKPHDRYHCEACQKRICFN